MPNFITKISPKDGSVGTISNVVGKELEKLSADKANIDPTKINSSAKLNGDRTGWTPEAQKFAEKIIDSLCFSVADGGGTTKVGPNDAEGIEDAANIKFVFEEAEDMVIVVPFEWAIAEGLKDPPLNIDKNYNGLSRLQAMKDVAPEFEAKLNNISDLNEGLIEEIMKAYHDTSRSQTGIGIPEEIFYRQLGEYTCRLCGH